MSKLKNLLHGALYGVAYVVFMLIALVITGGLFALFYWIAMSLFGIEWLAFIVGFLAVGAGLGALDEVI